MFFTIRCRLALLAFFVVSFHLTTSQEAEIQANNGTDQNNSENNFTRTWTVFWNRNRKKVTRYFEKFRGDLNFDELSSEPLMLDSAILNQLRGKLGDNYTNDNNQLKIAKLKNSINAINTIVSSTLEGHNSTCMKAAGSCCAGYEIGPSGRCEMISTYEDSACGGPKYLRNKTGIVSSPNYPMEYPSNTKCEWKIEAPVGHHILISFTDLDMEDPLGVCDLRRGDCFKHCLFDSLQFQDGRDNSTKALCGSLLPQNVLFYVETSIDITFLADFAKGGRGFKFAYSVVESRTLRPQTCYNGRVWNVCHRKCELTCGDIGSQRSEASISRCVKHDGTYSVVSKTSKDDYTCVPGCACPTDRPIWHNGNCIKIEQCPRMPYRCGIPNPEPTRKILGGRVARSGAWPWMVQVERNGRHICGGSLICSNWVITAAHCLRITNKEKLESTQRGVYWYHIGKYWKHRQRDGRRIQSFQASRVFIHPRYSFSGDVDDIALVQLNGFVKDFENVRPICLPPSLKFRSERDMNRTGGYPGVGVTCTASGWGLTKGIGNTFNRLKQVTIPIQPVVTCSYPRFDWRKVICAGGISSQDTCKGDSGGPFMCLEEDRYVLRGLTSFGNGCGSAKPGGYTRVSNYISWMRGITGSSCGSLEVDDEEK